MLPLVLDRVSFVVNGRTIIDRDFDGNQRRAAHGHSGAERRGEKRADAPVSQPASPHFGQHLLARSGGRPAAGHGFSAAGDAASLRARQRRLRAEDRRDTGPGTHAARARSAGARGPCASRPTVRRACCPAASSSGSRSRARGRSRRKCCFWTSPPPISTRRHAGGGGHHRPDPRGRHEDRDDHAQPRPGEAAGGRDPVSQPGAAGRACARRAIFQPNRRRPKPTPSSEENCHGIEPKKPIRGFH